MESEILQTLEEIRGILFAMAAFVGIGILFWVLRSIAVVIAQLQQVSKQKWRNSADDLFHKGEYTKLIKHCKEKLKEYPNDVYAIWWMARCHKELKEFEESKKLFIKVGEIEPSWKDEYVTPYFVDGEVLGSPANNGN